MSEQVKPQQKLVIIEDFCTRGRGEDCERCRVACPHEAISYNDREYPVVDFDTCSGCGICFGVCDAFASTRMTMHDLHARIQRIASSGRRVYITCKENVFPGLKVDSDVVVLPCISMLSPEFWTLMLAEGIRTTIACDLSYCEDCERAPEIGGELFPRAIEIAEERTGGKVLFTQRIPESKTLLEKYSSDDELNDRRSALTGLLGDVGEIASGKRRLRNSSVLADYYEKKERMRAANALNLAYDGLLDGLIPQGLHKTTLFPKQKLLLETITTNPDVASKIDIVLSETDLALCQGCKECIRICPTGARSEKPIQKQKKNLKMTWSFNAHTLDEREQAAFDEMRAIEPVVNPRLCIGCTLCSQACPHEACYLYECTADVLLGERAEEA